MKHMNNINGRNINKAKNAGYVASVALTGLLTTLLAACGGSKAAVPMNDEYAGSSGESSAPAKQSPSGRSDVKDPKDTGTYKDGTYTIDGQHGPVGDDTIDVRLTIANGDVTDVTVVGHPSSDISKGHQHAFIKAIPGVVEGKPLKGLSVDAVAGASWTSDAFNKALKAARDEASEPAAQ